VVRLFNASMLRASLTTLDASASCQVVNLRLRVDKARVSTPMPGRSSGVGSTKHQHRSPAFMAAHAHLANASVRRAPRGKRYPLPGSR
jgi:hypothetical protein